MHRSGTSPVTRMLNLLGADLATDLLPAKEDNARGFWESRQLVQIHDEILASGQATWDEWTPFDPAWYESPFLDVYRTRLLAYLAREFGASTLFVIKDPRMCRLVRLWREVLGAFRAEVKVVIPVRSPWEVAR